MHATETSTNPISAEARLRFWAMDGQVHLTEAERLAAQIKTMKADARTDANWQAWDGENLDTGIHDRVSSGWRVRIDAVISQREQHLADALTAARQGREIIETSEAVPA